MICDGLRYRRAGLLALLCLARQTRQAPVLLAEQEEIVIVKEASPGPDTTAMLGILTQYGYLPSTGGRTALLLSQDGVTQALRRFQRFGGLNESGILDDDTIELLQTPRCGVADNYEESEEVREVGELRYDEAEQESEGRDYYPVQSRQKRYALQGSRWKTRVLTYKVGKYPDKLSKREVDNDVLKAFSLWSQASGLKFIRRSSGSVNIEIRFEDYYHGDEDSFDGPGGVVAHAFFPEFGGDAHFDNGENWTVNQYEGTSLLQSLTHEFGHSLGLLHSSNRKAMMAPYHRGWSPNLKLHSDDITAVRKLYSVKPSRTVSADFRKNTWRNVRRYYPRS